MSRGGALLLVVVATTSVLASSVPAPPLVPLINRYSQGQYDDAVRQAAAIADLGPLRLRFVQDVPAWIAADPALAPQRRAAAAAFLAELTYARLETDWGRLSDLIEFTCAGLRAAGPPTPFELAWERASIALASRARVRVWLLGPAARLPHQPPRRPPPSGKASQADQSPRHLAHALARFPSDPQLRLAYVEAWMWGRDQEPVRNTRVRVRGDVDEDLPPQREAIVALQTLVDDPIVGAEALVRIAQMHVTMRRYADALAALEQAQGRDASPAIRYLAWLAAGRVYEALDKPDQAMIRYTKALEILPGAESATVALGSLQFVHDDRDAAVARLSELFNQPIAAVDPGRLVGYGSFVHWPALRDAMRAELPH